MRLSFEPVGLETLLEFLKFFFNRRHEKINCPSATTS
jgi:hypothetical protein